ncbi:metallopeptidase family protein [Nocardioides sp. TF02-7]|nr:metallopeptidase family protein [Nocardioides sp. TF02-7]UMG94658.1 metallopeptidase family protein [Nocardioides sp. TF02-7]
MVRGSGPTPTRLVVFRRPIEHRAADRSDLEAMVLTVVVEQVADLLGLPPSEVDPRYPDD